MDFKAIPPADLVWQVTKLRTTYVVQPTTGCGTMGSYPKCWTAAFTASLAKANKIAANRTAIWQAGADIKQGD